MTGVCGVIERSGDRSDCHAKAFAFPRPQPNLAHPEFALYGQKNIRHRLF